LTTLFPDNFDLTGDDEITLKGFLDLHVMTAEDEEGGEGEVWDILNTMGYNKQLHLDQVSLHSRPPQNFTVE
jgi:hypothetical protein